jgi:hypothetical protein
MMRSLNHFYSGSANRFRGASWASKALVLALLGGAFWLRAQDTNTLVQTNEVSQNEDLTANDAAQIADVSDEIAATNSVTETNQAASPGPDARTRRLHRRPQSRPSPDAQASAEVRPDAGTNTGPGILDYAAFRLVADRNIFNPNRSPRSKLPSARPKTVEAFSLVGTMSYEKGIFAFFDGTSSDYKKVVKPDDTIAGYKVVAISPDSAKLMQNTNVVELTVGSQMRRRDDGSWERSSGSESYAASSATPSTSPTEATPSGAESDIIKKMMERREKE